MPAGRVCWLHPEGDEHVADKPVGVVRSTGTVIPAEGSCARRAVRDGEFNPEDVVDHMEVNVGWVRS